MGCLCLLGVARNWEWCVIAGSVGGYDIGGVVSVAKCNFSELYHLAEKTATPTTI